MASCHVDHDTVYAQMTKAEAASVVKALEAYGATVNMTLDPDRGWFRVLEAVENATSK